MTSGTAVVMQEQEEDTAIARAEVTRNEPPGIAMMTRIMMKKTTMRIMTKNMMTGEEGEAMSVQDAVPVRALVQ